MRSFKKYFLLLLLILLGGFFLLTQPVEAQENMSPIPTAEVPFSFYGHRHDELHALGVIQELIKKTNRNCCDGGIGGECRVTMLRQGPSGRWEALLDGVWTPTHNAPIVYSIQLPADVPAVVCASKNVDPEIGSRGVYCIAASAGT